MTALNLTPRRLELLAAIDRGEVTRRRLWGVDEDVWSQDRRRKTVTADVERFRSAGLVDPAPETGRLGTVAQQVELTAEGREALNAAKEN